MARAIKWDQAGERLFETGVSQGVLYVQDANGLYPEGVAWNGLTGVTEAPSGAEPTDLYANDKIYVSITSAEKFGATIEAFTYPTEFEECDGSSLLAEGITIGQQPRKGFGLSYKTKIGNDLVGDAFGYKLKLIYGAKAGVTDKSYETINETPNGVTFSWEISTTSVDVAGFKPTSILTIDSTKIDPAKLELLENVLYGKAGESPETTVKGRLPLPDEVLTIIA